MERATETSIEMMERYAEALREAGVKVTHQRLEIYREVAGSVDHPDIETVFQAVRKRRSSDLLDTVYRTLALFEELGLVSTLRPRDDRARFDANRAPHHHFVCTRCGLTRDVYDTRLNSLSIPEDVVALGLCSVCSARDAGRSRDQSDTG